MYCDFCKDTGHVGKCDKNCLGCCSCHKTVVVRLSSIDDIKSISAHILSTNKKNKTVMVRATRKYREELKNEFEFIRY